MINFFIDNKPYEAEEGLTIFNAADQNGIPIPHFCYHPAFPPEGTCRMCLVEIEGHPKLELSCSTQIKDGMKVFTKTERVVEARRGVLEFLLAEHPIDCPICDQAGNCDLQDYYEEYGLYDSQFREIKEKKEKRDEIGKNLILDHERCVLCRRCVRFLRDVTKTREMGVFERGSRTEVNVYDGSKVDNNYSGNLAQLCPVGAITDKDFRFQTRNWFLKAGESICPLCSRGCRISIESHKGFARFPVPKRVYRIQSAYNPAVNSYWICDMGRYGYSYLNKKRLGHVFTNKGKIAWAEAISSTAQILKGIHLKNRMSKVALVMNSHLSNEALYLIQKLFLKDLGINNVYLLDFPDEKGDDFLLTPERSPNKRGVQEMGFNIRDLSLEDMVYNSEMLIVFGSFLSHRFSLSELQDVFSKIQHKILFTPYPGEFTQLFDIAFPVSLIAEKSGSLTNCDGIVQEYHSALDPPGESRAEWEILVDLAKSMDLNFQYYKSLSSPGIIRAAINKEISFFRK